MIISVVLAHYLRASASFEVPTFGGFIYITSFSYIMQGFLFISGFFSRNLDKCRTEAFSTFLFPYLVLMPIMFSIRLFLNGNARFDLTLPTMALWYLLTLFFYRYFLKDLVKIKNILPASIAMSLAAGFIPFFDSTLSLGRTFAFLPFYLTGYFFKAEWIEKIRKIPRTAILSLLTCLLIISVYTAFLGLFPLEAFHMKASYASTGLTNLQGIGTRLVLSLISLAWILIFINLMPRRKTVLASIGQNTMTIYVFHIVVRYGVKSLGSIFENDSWSYFLLIVFTFLSVWLFSRPIIVKKYQEFMNILYQWTISIPQALIRQIL